MRMSLELKTQEEINAQNKKDEEYYKQYNTIIIQGDKEVADLKPLRHFRELEHFEMSGTAVKDISPIAECEKIKTLKLKNNAIAEQYACEIVEDQDAAQNILAQYQKTEEFEVFQQDKDVLFEAIHALKRLFTEIKNEFNTEYQKQEEKLKQITEALERPQQ